MCMVCDGMSQRDFVANICHTIRERGWAVMCVEGDDDEGGVEPSFGYTVGLSRWDHPELIAFCAHPKCCARVLNRIAEFVLAGWRFDEGDDLAPVFPGSNEPAALLRFPDSSTHLYLANDFYRAAGGPPVPALQVFFPGLVPLLRGDDGRPPTSRN